MRDFIKQMIKSHEEEMERTAPWCSERVRAWDNGYLAALENVLEALESVDEKMVNDLAKNLEPR